ncbi:ATP-binding cassette domain-containing protein [Kitasatospora sp. NPDC005856]|uniref:ATP-binding cassette domain-containing protein n=1 Tax=Kitasatospora sp. NPDC005856 TaxID=3154566 RepID=UPI0033D0CBB4
MTSAPVLDVRSLDTVLHTPDGRTLHVLHGVGLTIAAGECLGVVGESGSGKSVLARTVLGVESRTTRTVATGSGKSSIAKALLRLPPPTTGTVTLDGTDLATLSPRALRAVRPRLQMVFQDPLSSLNPRRRVRDLVAEPLDAHPDPGRDREEVATRQLEAVGLPPDRAC